MFTDEMIERYNIILQNFFESKEYVVDTNTNYKSVIAKLLKNKCITDEDIPIKDGLENKLLVYRIENENDFDDITNKYPWKNKSTVLFMCERMEYIINIRQKMKSKRVISSFAFSGAGEEKSFQVTVSGRVNSLYEEKRFNDNVVKGYVFTAKLKDIIDIYNRRGENLFQKNVRFSLDDGTSDVSKEIIETLTTSPDEFWFLNNGITILSNADIDMNRKNTIGLHHDDERDFYVINGAQTVSASHRFFYEEKGENSQYHKDVAANQAMVLVRIIITHNAKKSNFGTVFGDKMSISLNRQKPIKAEDLAYYSSYVKILNQIYEEHLESENAEKYFKIVRRGEEKTNEYRMHSLTKVAKALFIIERDSPREAKNTSNDTALALRDNQLAAPIFNFAKGNDDDTIKNQICQKYLKSYRYVNWVIACEKAYSESIDKLVPGGDKKDIVNKTQIFMRNGNWYFVAYLLKDIIHDMDSENKQVKICTNETMSVLVPSFEKIIDKFFIDNSDINVVVSTFKKNDLYEKFIKYISKIKENKDEVKDEIYWEARKEMIKALSDSSKKSN